MSEPTAYDLEQDQIISEHSELLTVSDVAASGNQISYPVVGQPMTDAQWGWIGRSMGDGIISVGGQAYRLYSPDNIDNTMMLGVSSGTGTANALIGGYFHQLNDPIRLVFPAVTKTTVYYVALTYDPLRSQAADGPVSVQVYVGTPPTAQGKRHLILHTVERRANEVLTGATVVNILPRLSPTSYIPNADSLPNPATQMWGATMRIEQSGDTWIATGPNGADVPTRWKKLGYRDSLNDAMQLPMISPYNGSNLTMVAHGNLVFCAGQIITSYSNGISIGSHSNIGVVPAGWRPDGEIYDQNYSAPAVTLVKGATNPYTPDASIYIVRETGNLSIYNARTATRIVVSCYWRVRP